MDRRYINKNIKEEKRQMNLPIVILLSLIAIVLLIVIMNSASAQTAPPDVTKDVSPTDINIKGTGFDEITTITIEVSGAGSTTTTSVPMDVVFSIDSSGSMSSSDPTGLRKTAAKNFVDMMNPSIDAAGVISWDARIPPTWPTGIDFTFGLSHDFDAVDGVKYWINQIDAYGGTDLNLGLNAAIAMLDANPRPDPSAEVIIFLTDGQGTYTYSYNGGPAADAASKHYVIYSIGLGAGHAVAPLQDMATATGGTYYNSPTAANLQQIFNDIYTTITTSTIPHYVNVTEVTKECIVDEGSYNIMPDSVSTVGGITTIKWLNIGLYSGDNDPDLSDDEVVTLTFEAKSKCCGQNQEVEVYGSAKVDYDDNNGVYAGSVLIPQAYINVDCDTTPPTTTKDHGPCVFYDPSSGIWYMKPCNAIYLYARDLIPLATGVQFLHYEVWWDTDCDGIYDVKKIDMTIYDNDREDLNINIGEIDVEIHIDQECCHMLMWYAVDNFGNQEIPHEQHYRMDGTPPAEIIKTHPDPCYIPISPTEGLIKIGGDIVLEAIDGGTPPCISGIQGTYWGFTYEGVWHPIDPFDDYYGNIPSYFKDGKWWYVYTQPIEFHEECKHVLEYWAVDNVCNIGPTYTQTYWVNICRNTVWIDDDFHTLTPGWWHTKFVDKQMALEWLAPGGTAYVFDGEYYGDFVIDDVPCCDNTGITQMGEYGCFPVDQSAIIHGSETIKVNGVTIKYMEYDPNPDGAIIIDQGVSGTTLRCNKFRMDCIDDAVGVKSFSNYKVNARLNWWGKPDGPSGGYMDDGVTLADGLGVEVQGNVDVEPWLGVHAEASATTLNADTGEVILFNSDGTFAYTFGECCQTSEELPIEYLWEFDDGSYSMEENPAHVYDAPGTYNVILEIKSYDSRLWGEFMFDWAYLTIVVTEPSPLAANADGQDLGGYEIIVNEEIQLYGLATGGIKPYTYKWDLGDGTTSNEQNPVHVYKAEGIYTATLTVTDSIGDTASDTTEVTVYGSDEILVSIDVESNGIVGNNMVFKSKVIGGTEPYTYEWDFGDGTPTNEEANPIHVFENKGTYTVTLTVFDSNGKSDDATITINIKQGKSKSAEIKQVLGGFGVKVTIVAGDINCDWIINVNGLKFIGGKANGEIQANVQETVKLPFTFALGKVDITVTANEIQKDYTAFAIGPLFLSLKEA